MDDELYAEQLDEQTEAQIQDAEETERINKRREWDAPITKDIQLDNKVVSSHAKSQILFFTPVIEKEIVAVPLLDKTGKIVYKKIRKNEEIIQVPVLDKIKRMKVLKGFDKQTEDFPIKDWFNDNVTTSILEKKEAKYIRRLDDLGAKIARKMVENPEKVRITGFLYRLYSQKMSICDTGKGIGGGAIKEAKTSRQQSTQENYEFRKDQAELDEYKKRRDDKGLFGFGIDLPIAGKI